MSKVLAITPGGAAELREGHTVVWNSSDDESFQDEFTDDMLTENDLEDILEYLVEEDYITDEEADEIECEEETLDGENMEDEDDLADDDEDQH